MTKSVKVYVACGLTHVPRDAFLAYVSFIQGIARFLETTLGAEVKYALKDSDPQLAQKPIEERASLCYAWDRGMVEWADVIVGETSYPSTGLGIELQIACERGTPAILVFRLEEALRAPPAQYTSVDQTHHNLQLGDGYVSLMALGLPNVRAVTPYVSMESACDAIAKAISIIHHSTGAT